MVDTNIVWLCLPLLVQKFSVNRLSYRWYYSWALWEYGFNNKLYLKYFMLLWHIFIVFVFCLLKTHFAIFSFCWFVVSLVQDNFECSNFIFLLRILYFFLTLMPKLFFSDAGRSSLWIWSVYISTHVRTWERMWRVHSC